MKKENKVITLYLAITLGFSYLSGLLELIDGSGKYYKILGIGFTFVPVIVAFLVKRITGEKAKYHLSLSVWKNLKYWLLSAFLPGILIAIGTIIYYLIFPNEYSGIFNYGSDTLIVINHPLLMALICIIISALLFPIQLLELGEEIGWRGYLLGFQVEKYGKRKGTIINGFEWGLAHLPLIYFGFNYSLDNFGAPYTNMLMMIIVCIVFGIILSYVTIKTKNVMYAAIIHGVINVIGELPVYFSKSLSSGLLGPNPSGLISLLPMLILSILCLSKLDR